MLPTFRFDLIEYSVKSGSKCPPNLRHCFQNNKLIKKPQLLNLSPSCVTFMPHHLISEMKHLYTSGADHLTFEGRGGGGAWLISEKISYRLQFWQENTWGKKKNLPRSFRANTLKFVWHLNVQFVIQNIRH